MVTGKSHGAEAFQSLPPTAHQPEANPASPPSRRDLTTWWRQFKRNTRKEEPKENTRQGIFGVPLKVSIKYANVAISLTNDNGESFIYGYVPIVVAKCGVFLKEKATDVEGIFRLNGSAKRIKDLQEVFDSPERYGKGLDWTGYTVHDAANVLRRYLNQLPEPIVPLEFYERFREPLRKFQARAQENGSPPESQADEHSSAVAAYQQLIRELPPLNKQLLLYILDLLAVFASKSDQNRMNSANLSAIFQPGLLSHPQHDMSPDEYKLSQDVLIFLIENQDHFLVGMNGTAADEQTVKEVESGNTRPPTSQSTVRRSVSSASGGADSFRKYGSIRRNVSISSKNSRASNNASNPATPTSLGGSGVHRSNTLPSKMSPAIPPPRYSRVVESTNLNSPGPTTTQHSRSSSRTPPSTGVALQTPPPPANPEATPGAVYVHSAKHGPTPKPSTDIERVPEKPVQHIALPPTTVSPSPPAVVTPTKERKLSSFFTKSPPPGGDKEPRQPNRLKKKRIPGSTSESAHSSSVSLQAATSESALIASQVPARSESSNDDGGATPKPPNNLNHEEFDIQRVGRPEKRDGHSEGGTTDALRPHGSRTPSMNSRSSFTDYSDVDHNDEAARAERKDHRRSWRFPRSAKRSNEQIGLGLGSPPLTASSPGADRSTSSIGSWHHTSKSSPSDLQQFANDPSYQPLSLDAEVHNNGASKENLVSEPEKRSLFGKFKAKVAQVRDGVREPERDRTTSPAARSDVEKSTSSQNLPLPTKENASHRPVPIDVNREPKDAQVSSPVSPLPSSGLPPAIPEEPRTPDSPVHPFNPIEKTDEKPLEKVDEKADDEAVEQAAPTEVIQPETPAVENKKEAEKTESTLQTQ
ncbi:Putative Rho-GTPase-activating protein 5 [Aspergillus calidoustus]|uniref:Putative Rho-GTPase-activating protein 5 n=1 Tax=Aspergillus calidoustus TaxID=454130 RepID=A0A0U5FZ76_ASPCI|nr:Putative Rho-GTPase-activating protein 5 [Aspergillus calidoustus]